MESHAQYMLRRAQEEDDAAGRASSPKARQLHTELAGRYRDAADRRRPPKAPDSPAPTCLPNDFRILE
jgi:hypothetical protein